MKTQARLALVVIAVAAFTGCKQDGVTTPCVNMTGQSQLVADAATLRVAVYDGSVACSAVGSATPTSVRDFAKGAKIEMDVKAGTRTIVLSAMDATGQVIGQACTTASFGKGSNLCFDLVVEPVTPVDLAGEDLTVNTDGGTDGGEIDMAVETDLATEPDLSIAEDLLPEVDLTPIIDLTPVDLIPPPDLKPECTPGTVGVDCVPSSLCCGNKCVANNTATNCGSCGAGCNPGNGTASCTTGSCVVVCDSGFDNCDGNGANGCEVNLKEDSNHCGLCSRACSNMDTNVLDCTNGTCNSTCDPGFGNCTQPTAPTADNGCETSTATSATNCGGCGQSCGSQNNTARSCAGSKCGYTCTTTNFQDCNVGTAPNLDGCECEGTGCCAAGTCQGKHNTGLDNVNFYTCAARDAYSLQLAMDACNAYKTSITGSQACAASTCTNAATELRVCYSSSQRCACWLYGSATLANVGRAAVDFDTGPGDSSDCLCPTAADTQWH